MIDSHAHLSFRQFDEDRDEVVARAKKAGVTGWVEIGTTIEQSRRAIEIAEKYSQIATVGVHPSDVGPFSDSDGDQTANVGGIDGLTKSNWLEIDDLLNTPRVVAVGEVGFDFYHAWESFSSRKQHDVQKDSLSGFIVRALERDLPIVFHVRSGDDIDAHDALIDLLESLPNKPKGVIHTYSGSWEQAEKYLMMGMYISISGVVTFKNAGNLVEVVKKSPRDRLLVETDCPFLAPEPYRGKRNEISYVKYVAEKIAELRSEDLSLVESATTENTETFFELGNIKP